MAKKNQPTTAFKDIETLFALDSHFGKKLGGYFTHLLYKTENLTQPTMLWMKNDKLFKDVRKAVKKLNKFTHGRCEMQCGIVYGKIMGHMPIKHKGGCTLWIDPLYKSVHGRSSFIKYRRIRESSKLSRSKPKNWWFK